LLLSRFNFVIVFVVSLSFFVLTGCEYGNKKTLIFEGNAMRPTVENQDRIVVDKGYYKEHEVKRGDIILYTYEEKMNIKRVLGLPGDEIQIRDGEWYVNGEAINEDYIYETTPSGVFADLDNGIKLKEDEYFIIGDSPLESNDSRYIGPLKKGSILGKIIEIKPN
jgi:signal peptidase I